MIGHAGFLQRGHRAGLVAKVGQRDDDAVELAAVLAQEVGVDLALERRLHRAVAGGFRVEHQHFVARGPRSAEETSSRAEAISDAGKKPAIPEEERKT